MNETEKLKAEIQRILLQYMVAIHAQLIHSHDDVFLTDKILQACKETGLKFIPSKLSTEFWESFFANIRGGNTVLSLTDLDTLGDDCNFDINSQIKEIELEE